MAVVVRIIGLSLLVAGLAAWFGSEFLGAGSDASGISFILGCVGGLVGAVAGAAREIVGARGEGNSR